MGENESKEKKNLRFQTTESHDPGEDTGRSGFTGNQTAVWNLLREISEHDSHLPLRRFN